MGKDINRKIEDRKWKRNGGCGSRDGEKMEPETSRLAEELKENQEPT